ncbi:MAG: protein kinase domain-containing protein, partial [Verrucomicrobiales bacterium]
PKVIDFGIAKATEQRLTERTLFTADESFIGTPAYMSPEQAAASGLDIDTRSDIYSLGILLYELLVGQAPFDAAELHRLPLDEMRRTIREKEPERPSQKLSSLSGEEQTQIADLHATEPARLSGLLRGDLDWIVMRCLEKDRARRYATASELISDIGRHLSAQPVLARPPSALYRAKKLMRRHGAAIVAGSLLMLSLVGGTFFSVTQALRAKQAEAKAAAGELAQTELRAKAEFGEQKAMENAAAANLNEYVADINLTQLALSEGNFGRARQLLEKHRPDGEGFDHRGFEWRYLSELVLGDEHFALPNQGAEVQCLAYSPDGRTLAIGLPSEVRLWDVATRSSISSLPGGATSLLFLRDGQTLVSCDADTTWVVDTSTWLEVVELRGNTGPLALSQDGTQLATSSGDSIHIWDTANWFEIGRLPVAGGATRAFSPDGRQLASLSPHGITIWSLADEQAVRVLDDSADLFGGNAPSPLAFSPDGNQVIAARNTTSGRGVFVFSVWELSTGEEVGVLAGEPGHSGEITDLSLSRGQGLLASASLDHSIGLWDTSEEIEFRSLSGHRSEVWCVAISPDGNTVASGSKDGDLRLWPTLPPAQRDSIDGQLVPVGFSQDGSRLAATKADGTISIFSLPGLSLERSLPAGDLATVSSDLQVAAYAQSGGTVRIVNLSSMEASSLVASGRELDFLAISPDGQSLLTQSRLQKMCWWDLQSPSEPVATLDAESAIFSADGSTLATFGLGGRIEIWDTASRRLLQAWSAGLSFGFSAALSPDGGQLATSGGLSDSENLVSLWETARGDLIGTCSGHKQSARSLAFSPDGRTLATASDDGSLKLWNTATRQELLSIRRLGRTLRHLQFSPDGQWLVGDSSSTNRGGKVRLFHAPAG